MRAEYECSDEEIDNCIKLAPRSRESDIDKYCKYCTQELHFFAVSLEYFLPVTFTFTSLHITG